MPIARPVLDEREVEAVRRVVLSGWVTQGPEIKAFEEEFAAYTGAAHACAVSNCTTALHLALMAVGVGPGDEVVTVSHSFIATANAVRYCGAVPVFVDVEAGSFNMDPDLVEKAITPRTKAILCVHQLGMPADLARLVTLARCRAIPLIEDAACAIGSEILWDGNWGKIGRPHGDVACFSFHPRKVITTGDGGMITTDDPKLDAKFRLWRQHSMSVSDAVRHGSRQVIFESYPELGFNYRMTDLQAAIGREQLKRLPEIVAERRKLAALYTKHLASLSGVSTPREPRWARSNWQSYAVMLENGIDQQSVMQAMLDEGISTRRGIMNSHLEPAYKGSTAFRAGSALGYSEIAQNRAVILPLFPGMTENQIAIVADSFDRAIKQVRELTTQAA
ncbi:DegT/DnrJ/EryC1/StrS family aminotransferase [Mesorhizobium sp. RP14(2022)]|uniref:DegT/DnrJ/EryC1/StrS family aminotransferase n=1 Tax=Mesorhizobium liriopis TaxID=2953882 RepID=A0ABT1C2Q9_9HYPH|nr:DegT/DnrJ/EryC1/StrS family aminotransferase [Mesorhizobium liriopis]MCO6049113.1 DegT/DnrJ/EryC1/StrS family aminotransferase [Mesorhizobium liriopis]